MRLQWKPIEKAGFVRKSILSGMNEQERILELLRERSGTKQAVWRNAQRAFGELRSVAAEEAEDLKEALGIEAQEVSVNFTEKGDLEFRLQFSGDVLIFLLQTNAYALEDQHELMKTDYLKSQPLNGYFGLIHIYNFLSDSIKYGRLNDYGQLIGRLYINKEDRFFTEGQRQLGFLFRDLADQTIDKEVMRRIIRTCILHAIDLDLTPPPLKSIEDINVHQLEHISQELRVRKTSGLGFKTSAVKGRNRL